MWFNRRAKFLKLEATKFIVLALNLNNWFALRMRLNLEKVESIRVVRTFFSLETDT